MLALPGCAALAQEQWQQKPSHPPMRPYHLIVPDADMEKACGSGPWHYVYGCAVRIASERVCLIYTRSEPAAWIMEHERKHCAGWDHGPVRTQ